MGRSSYNEKGGCVCDDCVSMLDEVNDNCITRAYVNQSGLTELRVFGGRVKDEKGGCEDSVCYSERNICTNRISKEMSVPRIMSSLHGLFFPQASEISEERRIRDKQHS